MQNISIYDIMSYYKNLESFFNMIKTKKFKSGKFVKIKRFFSKLSINEMIKILKGVYK